MWCVKCVEWKSCEIARPKFLSYLCKKIAIFVKKFCGRCHLFRSGGVLYTRCLKNLISNNP